MKYLLILVFLLTGCVTTEPIKFYDKRTIHIQGNILLSTVKIAGKITALSKKSSEDINIVIDSPGGNVFVAFQIVDAIHKHQKNYGKVNCLVTRKAASAALYIFSQCSRKFAKSNAWLEFHEIGIILFGRQTKHSITEWHNHMNINRQRYIKHLALGFGLLEEEIDTFLRLNKGYYAGQMYYRHPNAGIQLTIDPRLK